MNEINIDNNLRTDFLSPVMVKKNPEPVGTFGDILKNSISEVNMRQIEADNASRELAVGNNKDIHQTMISLEKADISFQLMMQVRNKIIAAYEEIMHMQI